MYLQVVNVAAALPNAAMNNISLSAIESKENKVWLISVIAPPSVNVIAPPSVFLMGHMVNRMEVIIIKRLACSFIEVLMLHINWWSKVYIFT